jgi:hypothetical protein
MRRGRQKGQRDSTAFEEGIRVKVRLPFSICRD